MINPVGKLETPEDSRSRTLRYHLRFQIIPGRNVAGDARALANFCKRYGVEEVVLFFAAEEWNNGLLSAKDEDMWFDTMKQSKRILDEAGIVTSLNPWMTILHCDRGRTFPEDRKFKPAVSPDGEVSKACASLADPNWRNFINKLYGRFAELGFRVIWVEDDFRYHNRDPLRWGSGFESGVLKRFAKKAGRKVTRQEVVKNILKPGPPHPWRSKWMETWRELQLEVAGGLAEAVAENAPGDSKIGLMSSIPETHSIEGREWQKLFGAFTINGQVAHRPNFAEYSDSLGKSKGDSIMMLDVQRDFRPAYCEVAPEVDNATFTNWAKADSMAWTDMALCMFYGSDALLLTLFPFTGNPANEEPQIGALLDKSRPGLEWISARFAKDLETCGVGIHWRDDAQAYVRTSEGQSMRELNATFREPGRFLLPYGVPISTDRQEISAIFGSVAWSFEDDTLRRLLSEGLLLDGVSSDILCQRGFGESIGVAFKGWVEREEVDYSLELVVSEESGVRKGFYLNVNSLPRLGVLEPREGAHEWTTIITPERKRFGAGMVAYRNELGGRVVTCAVDDPSCLDRNYQRQTMTQQAVSFLANGKFASAFVRGGANLIPIHFKGGGKHSIVILNGSTDAAKPIVEMGAAAIESVQATLLAPLKEPVKAEVTVASSGKTATVTCRTEVPYLGFLVLEW